MGFLPTAAIQGAGLAAQMSAIQTGTGALAGGEIQAGNWLARGELQAANLRAKAARFQAKVNAEAALTASENDARIAEARAEADVFNAKVADQMAASEEDRAQAKSFDFRRSGSAALATSRASRAASGIVLDGSPLMVDQSIFQEIEFGVSRMLHEGAVSSMRLRSEGKRGRRSAEFNLETAKLAREAGTRSAANALEAGRLDAYAAKLTGYNNAYSARLAGYNRAYAAQLSGYSSMMRGISGFSSTLSTSISPWGTGGGSQWPLSLAPPGVTY